MEQAGDKWDDLAGALKARGVVENKHSTDVESPPPPLRVCMSNHPERESCRHVRFRFEWLF
jgi:hypothetical protein